MLINVSIKKDKLVYLSLWLINISIFVYLIFNEVLKSPYLWLRLWNVRIKFFESLKMIQEFKEEINALKIFAIDSNIFWNKLFTSRKNILIKIFDSRFFERKFSVQRFLNYFEWFRITSKIFCPLNVLALFIFINQFYLFTLVYFLIFLAIH